MLCKDCQKNPKQKGPRCVPCHRAWRTQQARELRQTKRQERLKDVTALEAKGQRLCSRCEQLRDLTEFRTSLPGGKGRRNGICDSCLTRMYEVRSVGGSLDYAFWRRRAYSCNCSAASRRSREMRQPFSLQNLSYVCKPQDLAKLYADDPLCRYCRVLLTVENLSVDHATPQSRGGAHALANLRLACGDCNRLKHTKTESEMREFLSQYMTRLCGTYGTGG